MKLVFFGVLVLLLPMATQATDNQADTKALQGTWLPATAELAGLPVPEDYRKSMKLTIKDDHYLVMAANHKDEGTCKVDSGKSPKTIEINGTKGPNQGKTIPAIYKIDGDALTVCYNLGGKDYPTEFKTKAGTKLFLVEYKREKP